MTDYKLYILYFVVTALLTQLLRKFALRYQYLIDKPNYRSLHIKPTVRGGGIIFVLVFVYISLTYIQDITLLVFLSSIALLGFIDDLRPLSAKLRFFLQILFSATYLISLHNNYAYLIVSTIFLVWMINAYNFMDGINGIAAMQAIFFLVSASCLFVLPNDNYLFLAASILGFLILNFPKAYVFMGDVGSGFLGALIGVIVVKAASFNMSYAATCLILMGVFIVDTGYTLFTRVISKQDVLKAHANHAYQHAAIIMQSHVKVSFLVFVINIFWLFPIAYLVVNYRLFLCYGLLLAYIPLLFICVYLRAGLNIK